MQLHGTCHCGNITFALEWQPDPVAIPARACDCTFCTRHGAAWTSKPDGTLRVAIGDASLHHRYAFGTHTADFHVCTRCGVAPLVTCDIDGTTYAVVNVNTFEGVDAALLDRRPLSLAEEAVDTKLARRQTNWIGDVRFVDRLG